MSTPEIHPSAPGPTSSRPAAPVTPAAADVTVVVVTYRGLDLLPGCLDSLDAQTVPHALLVVDNGSADGTSEYLASRLPTGAVRRLDENRGFAGGVDAALSGLTTRFVALLNDDAIAEPDWLECLLQPALEDDRVDASPRTGENPATVGTSGGVTADGRAAAWTSMMVRADRPGIVQNAGAGLLRSGYGTDLLAGAPAPAHRPAGSCPEDTDPEDTEMIGAPEVFGFCGGAALLRTAAVAGAGGVPASFFLYYEDTDLSWRLRSAGWAIRRVPGSRVRHAHSATSDQRSVLFHRYNERNRLWFLLRNAPGRVAAGAVLRFGVTTGSLAARRLLRQPVPSAPNLQVGLRTAVMREVAVALPRLLRERRTLRRRAIVPAAAIWREWAGRAD